MPIIGKITTLFSDKAKTKPIFPRTKTSAITTESGENLEALLKVRGDMTKQEYAGSGEGTVKNAEKLNNLSADKYTKKEDVQIFDVTLQGGDAAWTKTQDADGVVCFSQTAPCSGMKVDYWIEAPEMLPAIPGTNKGETTAKDSNAEMLSLLGEINAGMIETLDGKIKVFVYTEVAPTCGINLRLRRAVL